MDGFDLCTFSWCAGVSCEFGGHSKWWCLWEAVSPTHIQTWWWNLVNLHTELKEESGVVLTLGHCLWQFPTRMQWKWSSRFGGSVVSTLYCYGVWEVSFNYWSLTAQASSLWILLREEGEQETYFSRNNPSGWLKASFTDSKRSPILSLWIGRTVAMNQGHKEVGRKASKPEKMWCSLQL